MIRLQQSESLYFCKLRLIFVTYQIDFLVLFQVTSQKQGLRYALFLCQALNISQFCWEKVQQVLLGVWRYWEISGFCAGKQPAIKTGDSQQLEIPSQKNGFGY
ncbi:Hypothetical_protein [Hexamita inflata]|uniref:Hypothetical_protein n=1 Tax=Hexamita inflata TaxID=28002 RepID=A0AA86NZ50_9EUKA|nr:Hypothetical protein HINF_LOCUS16992 [Hexamita inflata]